MIDYPVTVPGDGYRGRDRVRMQKRDTYNRVATMVQDHINEAMDKEPDDSVRVFLSYAVATAIGADSALVRDIVSGIDAGSNGVTILKGNFDRAMARK